MRILRRLIVIFFILTVIGFAAWQVIWHMNNDTEAPVIQAQEDAISVSISATDEDLKAGMTATDNRDGDVTDSLVVVSESKFSSAGKRKIVYAAFDSQSNVATYERTLIYTDYTPPHFSLSHPMRFEYYGSGPLDYISAEDCLDGDISSLIKLYFDADSYTVVDQGNEEAITFQVTNSAGDTAQLTMQAEILDADSYQLSYPSLTDYLVYITPGEELTLKDYINGYTSGDGSSINGFSDSSQYSAKSVKIDDSAVDYSTPGTYRVVYTLYNSKSKAQGSVSQYIVVEEQGDDSDA